jgi:hypothetical protein
MPRKVRNRAKEQAAKRRRLAAMMIPDSERRAPAPSTKKCPECNTTLSRYNTGTYCHAHQRQRVWDGSIKSSLDD